MNAPAVTETLPAVEQLAAAVVVTEAAPTSAPSPERKTSDEPVEGVRRGLVVVPVSPPLVERDKLRAPDGQAMLSANLIEGGELRVEVEKRGVWNGVLLDANGHVKRVATELGSYSDLKTALHS